MLLGVHGAAEAVVAAAPRERALGPPAVRASPQGRARAAAGAAGPPQPARAPIPVAAAAGARAAPRVRARVAPELPLLAPPRARPGPAPAPGAGRAATPGRRAARAAGVGPGAPGRRAAPGPRGQPAGAARPRRRGRVLVLRGAGPQVVHVVGHGGGSRAASGIKHLPLKSSQRKKTSQARKCGRDRAPRRRSQSAGSEGHAWRQAKVATSAPSRPATSPPPFTPEAAENSPQAADASLRTERKVRKMSSSRSSGPGGEEFRECCVARAQSPPSTPRRELSRASADALTVRAADALRMRRNVGRVGVTFLLSNRHPAFSPRPGSSRMRMHD